MAGKTAKANGRPTDYNETVACQICGMIAEGNSLRVICEKDNMPDPSTVYRWMSKHDGFRNNYAKAQQDRMTFFAEDILEIADQYDNLADKLDLEHIQRAKLRIDTRKWIMSKMDPKRFGDKVTNEVTGPDGGPVQVTRIELIAQDAK